MIRWLTVWMTARLSPHRLILSLGLEGTAHATPARRRPKYCRLPTSLPYHAPCIHGFRLRAAGPQGHAVDHF